MRATVNRVNFKFRPANQPLSTHYSFKCRVSWPVSPPEPSGAFSSLKTMVAEAAGITVPQLDSQRRAAHLVSARWALWALAHKHMKLSIISIARLTGDKDHTTVLHGIKQAARHYDRVRPIIEYVEARLG